MIRDRNEYMPLEHYRDLARKESNYWWHVSRLNWMEHIVCTYCAAPQKLHALDYGCGMGGFLHHLNKRIGFASALGVDVSQHAIANAAKYRPRYRRIEPGDVTCAQDADIVFMMDVLEHIEHDRRLVESLIDALPAGGYIAVSVPANPFLFSSWDTVLGHYRRYSMHNLRMLFARSEVKFCSYIFSYLMPSVLWRRFFRKDSHTGQTCEFPPVPRWMNRLLISVNKLEIQASRCMPIMFGSSIMCLAQKRN